MKCPTQKNHLVLVFPILNFAQQDLLLVILLNLFTPFHRSEVAHFYHSSSNFEEHLYLFFLISYKFSHGFKPHLFYFLLISYCGLPFSWVLFCSLHECSFICVCLKWAGSQMNHHTCRGSLCLCFSFYWL